MDIELFVVPNCGRCVLVKSLLKEAGLAYTEVDASAGLGPLRRLKKLTGQAQVPVLVLGDEVWPALTPEQAKAAVAELAGRVKRD